MATRAFWRYPSRLQVVSKVEQSGGAGSVNSLEPGKERRGFVVSMSASGQNSRSCGEA